MTGFCVVCDLDRHIMAYYGNRYVWSDERNNTPAIFSSVDQAWLFADETNGQVYYVNLDKLYIGKR